MVTWLVAGGERGPPAKKRGDRAVSGHVSGVHFHGSGGRVLGPGCLGYFRCPPTSQCLWGAAVQPLVWPVALSVLVENLET